MTWLEHYNWNKTKQIFTILQLWTHKLVKWALGICPFKDIQINLQIEKNCNRCTRKKTEPIRTKFCTHKSRQPCRLCMHKIPCDRTDMRYNTTSLVELNLKIDWSFVSWLEVWDHLNNKDHKRWINVIIYRKGWYLITHFNQISLEVWAWMTDTFGCNLLCRPQSRLTHQPLGDFLFNLR